MPRANRYFLPDHVWHITHRCHKQEFLLKFSRDRTRWVHWLFEAKKRYGLSVLNYTVTSNHIHLLVFDQGRGEIKQSMQLIAGRVAQEYNQRKARKGAFWEDRYHATAVECDEHLSQCLVYIDMNMLRAGVVQHPAQWKHSGLAEMLEARKRYHTLDQKTLIKLLGLSSWQDLVKARKEWIDKAHSNASAPCPRNPQWSQGLAVGSQEFVERIKERLGHAGKPRKVSRAGCGFVLKEEETAYKRNFAP